MRDAVIVSTARTPIGRAYKGAFNATPAPSLAAPVLRAVVERAKIDPGSIDDVSWAVRCHRDINQQSVGQPRCVRASLSQCPE